MQGHLYLSSLMEDLSRSLPKEANGHSGVGFKVQVAQLGSLQDSCRDGFHIKSNSWLFDEPRLYQMLLRSNNPATEPFRKWVTEEVLPTISSELKLRPQDRKV